MSFGFETCLVLTHWVVVLLRVNCWFSPQVLVTVPLALLQKGAIHFNPPLSDKKMKAINSLGAGIIEKVTELLQPRHPGDDFGVTGVPYLLVLGEEWIIFSSK